VKKEQIPRSSAAADNRGMTILWYLSIHPARVWRFSEVRVILYDVTTYD
jgi:hypothetical protein